MLTKPGMILSRYGVRTYIRHSDFAEAVEVSGCMLLIHAGGGERPVEVAGNLL